MDQEDNPNGPRGESDQVHASNNRRARPPDVTVEGEQRIPLRMVSRSERMGKRESRVGLRSIFGRSKAGRDRESKQWDDTQSLRETSKPVGARSALADLGNWPYGQQPPHSDIALSSPASTTSLHSNASVIARQNPNTRSRQHSSVMGRALHTGLTSSTPKVPHSVWTPTPLFQAYPQAIRHSNLTACTVSVDTLLRLSGTRSSLMLRDDLTANSSTTDLDETVERKGRRLHQRNGGSRNLLDWTRKIYVLSTSGHLLQYSADGAFDRLPEKILRLSKDSVAFASDLIPGKHWVLQVSTSMEGDGTPPADSRSLFSKLRGIERKNVTTMLLVFDNAEDMDAWLAELRREIVQLGGEKKLSETGKPKVEDEHARLKTRPSQRTLVVRDPERFSMLVQEDFSWTNEHALKDKYESRPSNPSSEQNPEFPLDDVSTTESHDSSDGLRLDSLRDSNNRLSFVSSGQRTFVTSTTSSPACSPTRASFSSHMDEPQAPEAQPQEVRLRPNAQALADRRRQSMQNLMPGLDFRMDPSLRPHSVISNIMECEDAGLSNFARQSIPNFSKRFSALKAAESIADQPSTNIEPESTYRPARKSPPTALAMSRPLSTVMDQPSPKSPMSPLESVRSNVSSQKRHSAIQTHDTSASLGAWDQNGGGRSYCSIPTTETQLRAGDAPQKTTPRRFVSMHNLQTRRELSPESDSSSPQFVLSSSAGVTSPPFPPSYTIQRENAPSAFTPTRSASTTRRLSTLPSTKPSSFNKRSSLQIDKPPYHQGQHSFAPSCGWQPAKVDVESCRVEDQPVNGQASAPPPSSTNQPLAINMRTKSLLARRSMPHLTDGPPPVPPPNRALPPIPKKPEAACQ
ncbi:hypothetical protein BX600DRAFT_12926 [Xylariales sp. PMI_506]|nr:hypothetical protein BX600DRAFT_12926 [Xylariales sp. PMI_506]